MENKFRSLIESATIEQLDKILVALNFITNATREENEEFGMQLKNESFNVNEWVESKRPLILGGV